MNEFIKKCLNPQFKFIEHCLFGFKMPNLIESQLEIVRQETSLTVSEVVFNSPCYIESQPESLITTGGVDSFFEQEYIIENKESIKINFFIYINLVIQLKI